MQEILKNYINGRWETGTTVGTSENPSDLASPVAEYARADEPQAQLAVHAASEAAGTWAASTPQRRADVLDFVGSEMLARKEELGALLAREEGKTLPEAIAEAARAGQIFKFFAGEALRIAGDKLASVRPDIDVEVTREPVGVVAIIAAWNFPFA
ncbi:MAG: aldehyde dehydrogenase family protein, partial [Ramlibacter sp.]